MRWLSGGFAALFTLAAVLQANDPDPLVWILGYLAANEIVHRSFQSGYLGYWAAAEHAGQGYLRDAVALAIHHFFTRRRFRLHRLEANIQPENHRSIALAKACGLRLEGVSPRYLKIGGRWRDHERWAVTLEDWRRSRRR